MSSFWRNFCQGLQKISQSLFLDGHDEQYPLYPDRDMTNTELLTLLKNLQNRLPTLELAGSLALLQDLLLKFLTLELTPQQTSLILTNQAY